jgi:hypothetical protein
MGSTLAHSTGLAGCFVGECCLFGEPERPRGNAQSTIDSTAFSPHCRATSRLRGGLPAANGIRSVAASILNSVLLLPVSSRRLVSYLINDTVSYPRLANVQCLAVVRVVCNAQDARFRRAFFNERHNTS